MHKYGSAADPAGSAARLPVLAGTTRRVVIAAPPTRVRRAPRRRHRLQVGHRRRTARARRVGTRRRRTDVARIADHPATVPATWSSTDSAALTAPATGPLGAGEHAVFGSTALYFGSSSRRRHVSTAGAGSGATQQSLPTRAEPARRPVRRPFGSGVTIIGGQPVAVRTTTSLARARHVVALAPPDPSGSLPTRYSAPTGVALAPRRVARRDRLQDDDGAQHLAALHLVERLLDLVERDGLADEAVEVEPARQVQVDEHREVA